MPTFFLLAALGVVATEFLFLTGPATLLFAKEQVPAATDSLLKGLKMADDGFVYSMEGRVDPFVPFLTEKSKVDKVPV